MSGYILKVVGVVFLSIIVDLILPNGKMQKYVKSTVAIIIVFVIISPLPGLVKSARNLKLNTEKTLIDFEFVKNMNLKKVENIEDIIKQNLEKDGIEKVEIDFICDCSKEDVKFLFANVSLKNANLKEEAKNINLKERITEEILKLISIEKENILFYE